MTNTSFFSLSLQNVKLYKLFLEHTKGPLFSLSLTHNILNRYKSTFFPFINSPTIKNVKIIFVSPPLIPLILLAERYIGKGDYSRRYKKFTFCQCFLKYLKLRDSRRVALPCENS